MCFLISASAGSKNKSEPKQLQPNENKPKPGLTVLPNIAHQGTTKPNPFKHKTVIFSPDWHRLPLCISDA